MGGPDPLEYNDDLRVEEIETYKGANINKGNSPEARIIDESQQIDTRAEIEADNERRNTMNNINKCGYGHRKLRVCVVKNPYVLTHKL